MDPDENDTHGEACDLQIVSKSKVRIKDLALKTLPTELNRISVYSFPAFQPQRRSSCGKSEQHLYSLEGLCLRDGASWDEIHWKVASAGSRTLWPDWETFIISCCHPPRAKISLGAPSKVASSATRLCCEHHTGSASEVRLGLDSRQINLDLARRGWQILAALRVAPLPLQGSL